jgi:hypothetical protein
MIEDQPGSDSVRTPRGVCRRLFLARLSAMRNEASHEPRLLGKEAGNQQEAGSKSIAGSRMNDGGCSESRNTP